MRVLILSAILAYAAAAPSGLLAPAPGLITVPAVAYSAILPTISPGDLQAASIDANVKAQDLAIAAVDKARELSELAVDNLNERAESSNDQVKEKVAEEFWSVEDKKWQALDALKTAEAQIDGSVASNAGTWAKSAVIPYVALPNVVTHVAQISPIAYTPGIIAPELKTAQEAVQKAVQEVKEKSEAVVKSAESSEKEKDSVTVEAAKADEKSAEVKSAEVKSEEAKPWTAPVIATPLVAAPYRYPVVSPIVPSVYKYDAVPYGVQAIGVAPQIGLAPTVYNTPIYNTVW